MYHSEYNFDSYFIPLAMNQMKHFPKILLVFLLSLNSTKAQDTFSILAFDSITGEVGAAGASCVDLLPFPTLSNHFLAELFPGQGAIASQASYISSNQANARARFNLGESPLQILNWLQANDVQSNPSVRQYGVVRMMQDSVQTAAFTGSNCMNYKNHVVGPNYTIQGNILLGQMVLDSMEARFLREPGDLACKLMAAMQGAKMVGADTRCASNNSSSLFAFLKVTLPTDTFGDPAFLVSLKTPNGAGIEPIDSLQSMFSAVKTCTNDWVGLKETPASDHSLLLFPNPAQDWLRMDVGGENFKKGRGLVKVLTLLGACVYSREVNLENECLEFYGLNFLDGLYLILLENQTGQRLVSKLEIDH